MSALAAGLIAGGAALASGIGGALFNNSEAREQRDWIERQWQKTNEYNTPKNQVARLRQAGLNPGLAMSNGLVDTGSASTPDNYERPSYDFSPVAQGIGTAYSLGMQKKKTDAEVRNINANSQAQETRNLYLVRREVAEIDNILANKDLTDTQREYWKKQRDLAQKQVDVFDKNNNAQVRKQNADALLSEEQAQTERDLRQLRASSLRAGIRLSRQQQALIVEQVKEVRESVAQMIKNGVSQRQINHYVAQKEKQAAKQLGIDNWSRDALNRSVIGVNRSTSSKLGREHIKPSGSIFGISLSPEWIKDYGYEYPAPNPDFEVEDFHE